MMLSSLKYRRQLEIRECLCGTKVPKRSWVLGCFNKKEKLLQSCLDQ